MYLSEETKQRLIEGDAPKNEQEIDFWLTNFKPVPEPHSDDDGYIDYTGSTIPLHKIILSENWELLSFLFNHTECYTVAPGLVEHNLVETSRRLFEEYAPDLDVDYSITKWSSTDDILANYPLVDAVNFAVYCAHHLDHACNAPGRIYRVMRHELIAALVEVYKHPRAPDYGHSMWNRSVMNPDGSVNPENVLHDRYRALTLFNIEDTVIDDWTISQGCDYYLFLLEWEEVCLDDLRADAFRDIVQECTDGHDKRPTVPELFKLIPDDYPRKQKVIDSLAGEYY